VAVEEWPGGTGHDNRVEIQYQANGGRLVSNDLLAEISGVLKGLGANISNAGPDGNAENSLVFSFEGLKAGGLPQAEVPCIGIAEPKAPP